MSSSARCVCRHSASRIRARPPSGAATRTIMPSGASQYAPSGPARTNSKSRGRCGLANSTFARFIFGASLSKAAPAPESKSPVPLTFGDRAFRSGKVDPLKDRLPLQKPATASVVCRCRHRQCAARMRATQACRLRRTIGRSAAARSWGRARANAAQLPVCSRLYASCGPFSFRHAPARENRARTKGDRLVTESGSCHEGKERRPSDSPADSPGGMSSGQMRLLRRDHVDSRRRLVQETFHDAAEPRADALGGKAHGCDRSNVRAVHEVRERRCARLTSEAILPLTSCGAQEFRVRA